MTGFSRPLARNKPIPQIAAALIICLIGAPMAAGQGSVLRDEAEPPQRSSEWAARKCTLYAQIFRDALTLQGHDGLSNAFLSSNQRFIDAECQGGRTLCPISEEELRFADLLTIMTMNEGMASTFVPFGCPN